MSNNLIFSNDLNGQPMTTETAEISEEEISPLREIINRYNVLKAVEDGIRPDPELMAPELADQILELHKQLHPDGNKAIPKKDSPELHQRYDDLLHPWLYGRPVFESRPQDHTPERRKTRIINLIFCRSGLQKLHDEDAASVEYALADQEDQAWNHYRMHNPVVVLCKSAMSEIDDELMIIAGTEAQKAVKMLDATPLDKQTKKALKEILLST